MTNLPRGARAGNHRQLVLRHLVQSVVVCGALAACGGGPGDLPTGPSGEWMVDARTYYVAINEPGADNERCDGSSPTTVGSGRCPFKDFQSARTFRLLNGVANVRLQVRRGTYRFVSEGLSVTGTGRQSTEAVVLEAYNGEEVTLDGENRLPSIVRLSGQFVVLRGIRFVNAGGYHVEVRGGRQVRIAGNHFFANYSSDALKGSDGATDVEVAGNEFEQWDSQAIDLTGVQRWTISHNLFHDSPGGSGPLVAKLGTRDVRFDDNRIRDAGGLAFGGTSASHPSEYEAYDIVAERNTFERVQGHVVTFYSCLRCRFSRNDVSTAERGVRLGGALFQGPSGCAGGCRATAQATVTLNRFRDLSGDGEAPPALFWLVDPADRDGLSAAENLYCTSPGQLPRFGIAPQLLDFENWVRLTGSDSTSLLLSRADSRCQAW